MTLMRLGLPSLPEATVSRTALWLWSKRRTKPTCSLTPAFFTAARASSIFASLVSIGFAEDVLAGLRSAHDEVCMRCGGGADEHGLDGRIAKDHPGSS